MQRCVRWPVRFLALPLVAALGPAATAQAQVPGGRIVINGLYENVMDRTRPSPQAGVRTQQVFRVVLSGRNNIGESWVDQDPVKQGARQRDRRTVLGASASDGQGQWRVADESSLARIVDYPQNQTILTLTILGGSRCALSVEYRLKPGFSEFMFREAGGRGWSYFSSVRATSAACAVE